MKTPLPVPTLGEVKLYLRSRGLRQAVRKLLAGYIVGREQWYVTIEDLTRWVGAPLEPAGVEIRGATVADLPRMHGFTARQHPNTLRAWCRPSCVFFIALVGGEAVSYRCVSRLVHTSVLGVMALGPGQIYMVDEFTVPAFRRRGITRQLAIATNPALMSAGVREVVGIHTVDNQDTIAATRAKNIVTIGRLTRTRVGSRAWFSYEAFVPDVEPPLVASVRRSVIADARVFSTAPA